MQLLLLSDWRSSPSASRHAVVAPSGKEGGTLTGSYASFPDYLDPTISYTRRLDGDVRHVPAAAHLRPRQRRRGQQGGPRPGREPAQGHRRRQDLHADPAQGAQVLRRHSGQGLRLHQHDRTPLQAQLARLALLRRHRRRGTVRRRPRAAASRASRRTTRRGKIIDRPDPAARHLHQRAGAALRRAGAARHAGQDPRARTRPRPPVPTRSSSPNPAAAGPTPATRSGRRATAS